MRTFLSRVGDFFVRARRERRLREEIDGHLALLADEYERTGMTPADARLAAHRAFGGVTQMQERCRDQRGFPAVDALLADVRHAARVLMRDRWFTAAAATALALGIGVATTIFTIVYSMNWRALPFAEPERLMALGAEPTRTQRARVSYTTFLEWQQATASMSGMAAYLGQPMTLSDEERAADSLSGTSISAEGFDVLGIHPALGRDFAREDDRIGAAPVVIIGHAVWRDRYGADPAIVGRAVRVNGTPATVIGVMPEGFRFPLDSDIWQPIAQMPKLTDARPAGRDVNIVARLAGGVTMAQARAELAALSSASTDGSDLRPRVMPLNEAWFGRATAREPLLLMVCAGLILLVACTHAANLLLARSAARGREMAVRAALGAGRRRIMRQLLVESLLVAIAAGVLSLVLSVAGVRTFAREVSDFGLPYWTRFSFDGRVFAFVATSTLGTGVLFGLVPALRLSRTRANDMLRGGDRALGAAPTVRWRRALVVGQMTVTMALLGGAGLVLQSALALSRADALLDTSALWTMRLSLPAAKYETVDQRTAFYRRLEERLAALPDGAAVTIASAGPFFGAQSGRIAMDTEGPPTDDGLQRVAAVAIGPRYFETLGVGLIAGRHFREGDAAPGGEAAIVNARFVERFSADRQPVGRHFWLRTAAVADGVAETVDRWIAIVGVAPSIRQSPGSEQDAVVYLPHDAYPSAAAVLIARDPSGELGIASRLREEVRAIDQDLPLAALQSAARTSEKSRWPQRSMSTALTSLAAIGTLLSIIGLYGLTAYGVAQRRQEIGLRMALGARASQVSWLFLRSTAVEVAIGLLFGIAGALALRAALRGLLVGIAPTDPPTTIVALATLFSLTALSAGLLPARRAARLDPVQALRHE